ncbi:MAG: chromosome partitioning protein ParB [Rhizobiaceae bacterium]
MSSDRPFSIDVGALKSKPKPTTPQAVQKADSAGAKHGFVEREPKGRRGRQPSPRTGQVHAKVMPEIATAIGDEARRRGVQQGVIVEEAWALYCERHGL